VGNSGRYGQRALANCGVIFSLSAISDDATTTLGEMGSIIIDKTDGKISMVDSSSKTQDLTS